MSFLLNKIMNWVIGLIVASFQSLFDVVQRLLAATPTVTGLPQVRTLTARTATILDVLFVLAFVAAGVLTVAAGGNERARYTAKDLLPRLVVAFVAAHFSPLFTGQLILLVNAVASALSAGGPSGLDGFAAIRNEVADGAVNNVAPLLFAVLAALITFLVAAVAFSYLARIGVLVVLAIVAPLALACHSLPQTDPIARLWWRSLVGCLAIPLLQTLVLQAGHFVLLDPHAAGALYGRPGGGLLSLLVTIVLLWLAVKIPGLVRRYVTGARGSNPAGHLVRVLVVQQGLRAVTGGLSTGGRVAVRAGAAALGRTR
jgi:hypothetical protein